MQRVVNICLGSALSTVSLTIPAVLLVGILSGKPASESTSRNKELSSCHCLGS
jgi:Ca2+/H+ antiporter